MNTEPSSVCFVAPNNYAVLSGRGDITQIGGAEVQRVLIAKELVRLGWRVSFVTLDHGQPDGIEHDGIRVFKMCAKSDGLPGLRFLHPRWTSLCGAMRRADADIYIQRTAGVETGQAALWARRRGRRFVYSVANEPECDGRLGGKRAWRERRLFQYGLTHANRVVAQTVHQRAQLKRHHEIDATVIRSCAPDPGDPFAGRGIAERFSARRVLWVGRFAAQKRIDRLAAVAQARPDVSFDVVGDHPKPGPDVERVVAELRRMPNVTLHGFVPYREMPEHYDAASLLICTSDWEGFPNTFMEAWSRGVPAVSTVDPDGVIEKNGLGRVTPPDGLADAVFELLGNQEAWRGAAERVRAYYLEHHTPEAAGAAWNALLGSIQ